jgi:hypothetical protein
VKSVFVLLLPLYCFIFILVLLLCCVYRSSLYCNIPSELCTLSNNKTNTEYTNLKVYYSKVMIWIHNITTVQVQRCNIPSDLCSLCLSCYYFYIVLSLYLYCCYVMYLDHHFTVIYLQTLTRQTQSTQVWRYITVKWWSVYTT